MLDASIHREEAGAVVAVVVVVVVMGTVFFVSSHYDLQGKGVRCFFLFCARGAGRAFSACARRERDEGDGCRR